MSSSSFSSAEAAVEKDAVVGSIVAEGGSNNNNGGVKEEEGLASPVEVVASPDTPIVSSDDAHPGEQQDQRSLPASSTHQEEQQAGGGDFPVELDPPQERSGEQEQEQEQVSSSSVDQPGEATGTILAEESKQEVGDIKEVERGSITDTEKDGDDVIPAISATPSTTAAKEEGEEVAPPSPSSPPSKKEEEGEAGKVDQDQTPLTHVIDISESVHSSTPPAAATSDQREDDGERREKQQQVDEEEAPIESSSKAVPSPQPLTTTPTTAKSNSTIETITATGTTPEPTKKKKVHQQSKLVPPPKRRARFVVEDPEKACGRHVDQCDEKIALLEKRLAELDEMDNIKKKGAVVATGASSGKLEDTTKSITSSSSPLQQGTWRPKARISHEEESKMVDRLTRPKVEAELEDIPIGNRFRSREDEDEPPIDEIEDEDERIARIEEMVERLATADLAMRYENREDRIEQEAPNAPGEQWKTVVATLKEGRRRFRRIMNGGEDDEDEEEDDDEEDEEGGPYRLSIEKQDALAQRLCTESLRKKQEGAKELTRKFYGDDAARRKQGVLSDHYQATGRCLPHEYGTIGSTTSKSPYRRYGSTPSLGPASPVKHNKKLSPSGVDDSATTPLRHQHNTSSSTGGGSPPLLARNLPPIVSPVVARRLQREKKAGGPERQPTPAELGKRLHDDSRSHHNEKMKLLHDKYLVNPLTQSTQFGGGAVGSAGGSTIVDKPIKYIDTDQVKALADRLSKPVFRTSKPQ